MIKYTLLSLIAPISLYINFFIAKKTPWNLHIKAWLIYSTLIVSCNILIILILFFIRKNFKITRELTYIDTYFLIGNIFFIFPYHNSLWYLVPLFQLLIIVLGGLFSINKKQDRDKLDMKKKIFTLKKEKKPIHNSLFILIGVSLLISTTNIFLQWNIINNYNPYKESLRYELENTGIKVLF